MTTRRLRRAPGAPWRGLSGRLGLFPSAIAVSVEPNHLRLDRDRRSQRARERPPVAGTLEAHEATARVDASAVIARRRRHGPAVARDEADQLLLWRPSAAAGAAADGLHQAAAGPSSSLDGADSAGETGSGNASTTASA